LTEAPLFDCAVSRTRRTTQLVCPRNQHVERAVYHLIGKHGHKPTTYVLTGKWGATEEEDGGPGSFGPGSIPY